MTIPPVFIDGLTYVLIAFFGAWAATFSTEEAAKYISPQVLFWLRAVCASSGATLLAMKMFRSTSYSDHQQAKRQQQTLDTQIISRPVDDGGSLEPTNKP